MSTNLTLIETKTVGAGGVANIDFTSIPATYTDLKLVVSLRDSGSNVYSLAYIKFNNTTSNLSSKGLEGDGSSISSYNNSTVLYINSADGNSATANVFSNQEIYIPNYSVSGIYKSVTVDGVMENNAATAYSSLQTGLWSDTSAINRITIYSSTGNWLENSTASLYGISAVTSSPKATGGMISQDSTYWYHTFATSGIFAPTAALSADILVIAGGGGGANNQYGNSVGGGGGAGGLLGFTSQSLSATNYAVVIGAGGSAGTTGATSGTGGDSQFGALTLVKGGGRGAGWAGGFYGATNGGSGGGGSGWGASQAGIGGGGSPTSGQGYAGGSSVYDYPTYSTYSSAGGGGAGGNTGTSASSATVSGNGGVGLSTYSSWGLATFTGQIVGGTAYFAGGGGAGGYGGVSFGTGGFGGGGIGANVGTSSAASGLVNTGGGGGGGGNNTPGAAGAGGSGLVIVRYAK
jgi:hypothetical protein